MADFWQRPEDPSRRETPPPGTIPPAADSEPAAGEVDADRAESANDPESPAAPVTDPIEPSIPPPPSPFARLSHRPARVVSTAFDVLTQASGDLRRASFYIGLLVLVLATPFAILAWRLSLEGVLVPVDGMPTDEMPPPEDLQAWAPAAVAWSIATLIAVGAMVVTTLESRAVAASVLAARLAGRPLELRTAVQRSRTVFWRLAWALVLTSVPLYFVQSFLEDGMAALLGGVSEPSVVSASLLAAVLFAPLAYVVTGVVLGDVGAWTAVRRSVGLFRAAKSTAVVVALFEFGAQLLVAFALLAGADLILRAFDASGLSVENAMGAAVAIGLIVALAFATGSLLFTVAAVAIAPQVVAFLALTHAVPGLSRIGGEGRRFRWLTVPLIGVAVVGAITLVSGLTSFD